VKVLRLLLSWRGIVAIAALIVILVLFRPSVYRLHTRIAGSIGSALGRRVEIDNVRLRILPQPGFDLEGLVIYDDPAFSPEPMMRAQAVSAAIRLRSLLRGRIEIATLSATEPSINLVRSPGGRWNLASLIERNAQIPAAPTEKAPSERRPSFPYLEATHARINFKIGQTKKSYALVDADVALWQDSENSWGARMKAAPVRTDFNLTDTGVLQFDATWRRASSLRITPMQVDVQWQKGQLGQITKLLSGRDRGWRGGVTLGAKLSGTPEALKVESQTMIDGFHRYDIVGSENVRLATVCSGQYDAVTSSLADLLCESPVNGGAMRIRGALTWTAPSPTYDLTFDAEKIPLSSLLRLLRQAKKQIPGELTASGLLSAKFRAIRSFANSSKNRRHQTLRRWTGSGEATNIRVISNAGNLDQNELNFGTIPLTMESGDELGTAQGHGRTVATEREHEPAEARMLIGPVTLAVNGSTPVSAGGWISMAGYRFFLRGDMELKNMFRLEGLLGLPVARPAAEGAAKLDVSVVGPWQGFAPPVTMGTVQLRNVRGEMRGLNTPIEITSATMSLTPDTVSVEKISARTGDTHWTGGVIAPRHCAASGASCRFQFDLTADHFSTGDLAEWLMPRPAKHPWYRILNADEPQGASPLRRIQAHGNLHIGRFSLKRMTATQVTAQVDVDQGRISLTGVRGQLLQGLHMGNWIIDTSNQPVQYHGSGTLQKVSLARLGTLMDDTWITGTADGKYDLDGSGDSFGELLASADGKLQFTMRNGILTRVEIPSSAKPLLVHRFSGELYLKKGVWELSLGRLESHDGFYQVHGTASVGSGLDFLVTRGEERSWAVTGTLAKPHVATVSHQEEDEGTAKP
jgi:hypothetical protein